MNQRVIAVVVTYNRANMLRECLDALQAQTYPVAEIIVVNNASSDNTRDVLENEYADKVHRIHMEHNVGGAGGFRRGMKWAYDNGADWLWLMDDDGVPQKDALAQLMTPDNVQKYDLMNSLVINRQNTSELSFGLSYNDRAVRSIEELKAIQKGAPVFPGEINPFNGTLISRKTIDKIGYTRPEMFIWGDEVDFNDRVKNAGLNFGTVMAAHHHHPASKKNILKFGPFGTLTLAPPYAANIAARNLGYLAGQKHSVVYRIAKPMTYVLYFITKGQFKAAWNFAAYWVDGLFDRYKLEPSRATLLAKNEQFEIVAKRAA